jgi:hypothetical protein
MLMSRSLPERTGRGAVASDGPGSHVACGFWGHLCVIAPAAAARVYARVLNFDTRVPIVKHNAGASCRCWLGGTRCNHKAVSAVDCE